VGCDHKGTYFAWKSNWFEPDVILFYRNKKPSMNDNIVICFIAPLPQLLKLTNFHHKTLDPLKKLRHLKMTAKNITRQIIPWKTLILIPKIIYHWQEGKTDLFDCVVMTMPTPQILQVAREVLEGKPELKRQLESVQFR